MLSPIAFVEWLTSRGVIFFTGVPDSLLKEVCTVIQSKLPASSHVIAANEGGAIGLAIGHYLATGHIPLVYLQNSGLGNTINPLLSLADPDCYAIPMLLLTGWRGRPGHTDEPQHQKQGRVMIPMLEAMELPYIILDREFTKAEQQMQKLIDILHNRQCPGVIIVEEDSFLPAGINEMPADTGFYRNEAIAVIAEMNLLNSITVSTTGKISRELYECREALAQPHEQDFLNVGGMGHCSQIALGIALAKQQRIVVCLDGDGASIMHMGSLAIIGACKPVNYRHILINNGCHESVGGQPTAGTVIDFCQIAIACGYNTATYVHTEEALRQILPSFWQSHGPSFLEIRVGPVSKGKPGRPRESFWESKQQLMKYLDKTR
jgi:phosphonopyruvate decarboxylase